ncbi:olfactory receptor 2T29-like [Symphalangus syndactylus]|uniref:olfactory receptor 2T29-like n=1 Tax=Symphalangus syndactylus TaxID=9590 RepID=UPI002441A5F2|nr:olfactory receptor 2T29-like [Symphalangus syndactylus]
MGRSLDQRRTRWLWWTSVWKRRNVTLSQTARFKSRLCTCYPFDLGQVSSSLRDQNVDRRNETLANFFLLGLFPELQYISVLITSLLLVYIIAFSGNAILILLIWADSCLHTPMYTLLSHPSLIDLALISTTVPKMTINFFSGKRDISKVACGTQIFFFFALGGSECLLLTLMSYDHYMAICNPLRYSVIMNPRVCLQIALVSWGGGALNSLINTIYTMHFPFCGTREIHHFFCEMPAVLQLSCEDTSLYETVASVICIVFVLLPLGLIISSYMLIFLTVLRMNSPEGRREALTTCSSHLAAVSLYDGPAMFIYMMPHSFHTSEQDEILSMINTIFTPMLNPLVYSLRNKEVLASLRKLMNRRFILR